MKKICALFFALAVIVLLGNPRGAYADTTESTRVTGDKQHVSERGGGDAYRGKSEYIVRELDLKPGDVVVDIGAGDGWWTEKMAEAVGDEGIIHAGEVVEDKVQKMKEKFADMPQVKPYLCPTDGTGLEEDSCDLAFISKTYHHLDKDGHVDYLQHLGSVVKPTGRLVVVERYRELAGGRGRDHAWSPGHLTQQAEEAGWILARSELITGTYHFIAIFLQKDLFPAEPPRTRPECASAESESTSP